MANAHAAVPEVRTWQLVVFALPAMMSALMHGPFAGILPALYAERFGLDLTVIGIVLLTARIFDAATDPVIGLLSDRTRSRFGRRKPWIVVGTFITIVAMYLLLRPVGNPGISYFLILLLTLYLGWTIVEIPYSAWSLELSRDSGQRAKINAFRSAALFAGGILFTIAPMLVPSAQGRMGFEALGILALILVVAAPLSSAAAVAFVPQGSVIQGKDDPKLSELWQSLKANPPFQIFVLAYMFIGLASGISGVVGFLYIDSYLKIGGNYTQLFLPATLIGPLMLPVWAMVLKRFDKYRVTAIAFTIYACLMPLAWFVEPGPDAFIPMMLLYCGFTLFTPLLMIAMPTILGDVIDFDELRSGKNRAGQYYSFLVLIAKGTTAAGGPLALMLIGLFGYQPGAATNDATAILGLRLVNNILPALVVVPGVICFWLFPMTDKRHREIRDALDQRAEATAAGVA